MLRLQARAFSSSCSVLATAGKQAQKKGYNKKDTGASKPVAKKVVAGSLHKPWKSAVATAKFNANAPALELPVFNPAEPKHEVAVFSGEQQRFLHRVGGFKQGQFHELFWRPICYTRKATEELLGRLSGAEHQRVILTGQPGVGKSTLLAQAQVAAYDRGSVIINISHPELFLNGRNDFRLANVGGEELYTQPMYLKTLLTKILKANKKEVLSAVALTREYKFPVADTRESAAKRVTRLVPGKHTLFDLLSTKTAPAGRGMLFQAVIDELAAQSTVPVYFTVDNFSRILSGPFSAYKDTSCRSIHVLKLQLGKIIMNFVSGATKFNHKDSRVVLATSGVDRQTKTLPAGLGHIPHDPYATRYQYEPTLSKMMLDGGVKEFRVEPLSKTEVAQLVDFYSKAGILSEKDQENSRAGRLVDEKYLLSGNGNPRELLKSLTLYPF
ncbi:AaceriAFL106Cp [[Ashbya] aceris (nom. inval.)]|nr:AaceriAFL106Cp [[Ashbya] aceris (nom. inval.)]